LPGLNLPFDVFVWLAWSVKESVYKFLKRDAPLLVFSPTKICLKDISIANDGCYGTVKFRSELLYYRTEVTGQWIHSVVNAKPGFEQVKSGIKRISPTGNSERSALAKQFLLDEVQAILGGSIAVSKSISGYPVIVQNGKELDIPVSLSHDGDFAAYSMYGILYQN
jgi:phosphopantetheinyl transferase (holo-ACP synthase)